MADEPPTDVPESRRGTKYDDATRAACMAALLAGQRLDDVATEYKIPAGTLRHWKREARKDARGTRVMGTKREEIGELLVDYLASTLKTIKAQQVVFADPVWLKAQEAGQLAVLHGVLTDKAIRLLEALGGTEPAPAQEPP